jgi:hypothetical protein
MFKIKDTHNTALSVFERILGALAAVSFSLTKPF